MRLSNDDKDEASSQTKMAHAFPAIFKVLNDPASASPAELRLALGGLIAVIRFWQRRSTFYRVLNPIFLLVGFLLGWLLT